MEASEMEGEVYAECVYDDPEGEVVDDVHVG